MCSVATNPVKSLEFNPISCATTLCHYGGTRNGYVATHIFLLSRTAESSAKSGYVVVPERFSQNEKPSGSNKERTRKKPRLVRKVDLIVAIVILSKQLYFHEYFSVFYLILTYF